MCDFMSCLYGGNQCVSYFQTHSLSSDRQEYNHNHTIPVRPLASRITSPSVVSIAVFCSGVVLIASGVVDEGLIVVMSSSVVALILVEGSTVVIDASLVVGTSVVTSITVLVSSPVVIQGDIVCSLIGSSVIDRSLFIVWCLCNNFLAYVR